VLFSTLAGFAFAKLRFRGRNALFVFVVATLAVPTQLGIIPLYMAMSELGWAGDLQAVIVPNLVTAFGVFWMRQYTCRWCRTS
jgi:cellobiose transport system permease protein